MHVVKTNIFDGKLSLKKSKGFSQKSYQTAKKKIKILIFRIHTIST